MRPMIRGILTWLQKLPHWIIGTTVIVVVVISVWIAGAVAKSKRAARDEIRRSATAAAGITNPKKKKGRSGAVAEERFKQIVAALQERSQEERQKKLTAAIGNLTSLELVTVLERARKLPAGESFFMSEALLDRLFELDPDRAAAWVKARPRDSGYWQIWAEKFPRSVLVEAHLHPVLPIPDPVFELAVGTLAGPDAKAQAMLIAGLPVDPQRDRILAAAIAEWAKTDSTGALAFAHTLPLGDFRHALTESILRARAQADTHRAATDPAGQP